MTSLMQLSFVVFYVVYDVFANNVFAPYASCNCLDLLIIDHVGRTIFLGMQRCCNKFSNYCVKGFSISVLNGKHFR
jgi:hypothetical protein